MAVGAVDQGDIDIGMSQPLDRVQATEAGANDDDMVTITCGTVRLRPRYLFVEVEQCI